MKKLEFTDEIKNKVLDLIAEEYWLPKDYDYNITIKPDNTMAFVMCDGVQVWVINQMGENGQSLANFFIDGSNMVCATFPWEVMEVANALRNLNDKDELRFVWDYIYDGEE